MADIADIGQDEPQAAALDWAPSESSPAWAVKLRSGAVLLGLFLVMIAAPNFQPFNVVETWLADLEMALLAPSAPPHPAITVVDINERVAAKLEHRSPIDRKFLARLITALAAAKPMAIGVDVLIDRPTEPGDDAALTQALQTVDVPVIMAWAENASAPSAIDPSQEAELRKFYSTIDNRLVERAAVNLQPDADGVVRNAVLRVDIGSVHTGFATALARTAGVNIDPDAADMVPLAYYGHSTVGAESFNTLPADAFLSDDPQIVESVNRAVTGKIIIIGASLADTDRHRTPFALDPLSGPPSIPGMLIHAHAVAQLLDGRSVAAAPLWLVILLSAVAVVAGFQIVRSSASDLRRSLMVFASLLMMIVAAALIFRFGGETVHVPGPTFPLGTTLLGFMTAATLGIEHERRRVARDRHLIRSVLSRYLPEQAIEQQLQHPEKSGLNVERRDMSFVFTDIAGFTGLCETTRPEQLVPVLNAYLGVMTEIITTRNGTVGGFIGDAVVAFWGAPIPDEDHPTHALEAAIAMDRAAQALRISAREQGLDFGRTRIGVHTGVASLGNFGGPRHLEYMAHGDVVNTTQRLESANKFLGTHIAVSEVTAARARGIRLRPAADITFKGKSEELSVFEPIEGMPDEYLTTYMEAYDLMRERSPLALEVFEQFHRRWPDDKLVEFHVKRLRRREAGCKVKLKRK